MKKIIYSLIITIASCLAFTSCSEEEIKPQTDSAEAGHTNPDKGF